MRRINIRASLLAAVAFIFGIISFYEMLFGEFYFGIAVMALLIVALVAIAIWRKTLPVVVIAAIVFVIFGFLWSMLFYRINTPADLGKEVTLTGRVTDLGRNGSEYNSTYYLEKCSDEEGNSFKGRVKIVFPSEFSAKAGDVVTVKGSIHCTYPVQSHVQAYFLRNRVWYELTDAVVRDVTEGRMKLGEQVRRYIYNVTSNYAPNNGGLIYALLTGDRSAVDETAEWAFSRAGIAHLLAVSGLHVGFIAAVFGFALKRFHLRPWVECIIVTGPLLFYAYICGFSPSVMRAVVMLLCSYLARTLGARYDMLTSIAWAALVTLLICPFYLLDAGFQLSFMSVFGIVTLFYPLNRMLKRRKVGKLWQKLIAGVAVSLCCVLSTLLVLAAHGGDIALFGVFFNIIAIPIISAVFVLCILGLLPWVFHYLIYLADAPLQVVMRISEKIASLSFATVSFKTVSLSVVVLAILFFAVGGFINLGKLGRKIYYPICSFLLVLSILLSYIPRKSANACYVMQNDGAPLAAVLSDSGEAALVGDFDDYNSVSSALSYLEGYRVTTLRLYFCHYANANADAVARVTRRFEVVEAYLLSHDANDAVTNLLSDSGAEVIRQYPNTSIGQDVVVSSVYNARLCAVTVKTGDIDLCFVYDTEDAVLKMGLGADVYFLRSANAAYAAAGCVTVSCYQSSLPYNYGANKYGNFTITQKHDTINLNFR